MHGFSGADRRRRYTSLAVERRACAAAAAQRPYVMRRPHILGLCSALPVASPVSRRHARYTRQPGQAFFRNGRGFMGDVSNSWDRIERWLAAKAKRTAGKLRPRSDPDSYRSGGEADWRGVSKGSMRFVFAVMTAPDSALIPAVEDDDLGFSPLNLEEVVANGNRKMTAPTKSPTATFLRTPAFVLRTGVRNGSPWHPTPAAISTASTFHPPKGELSVR